jgi:rubredoxin
MDLKCKKCGYQFDADDVDFIPNWDTKFEYLEVEITCDNCEEKYFTRITPEDLIDR